MTISVEDKFMTIKFDTIDQLVEYRKKVIGDISKPTKEVSKKPKKKYELTTTKKRRKFSKLKVENYKKIKKLLDDGLSWTKAYKTVFGFKGSDKRFKTAYFRWDKTRRKPRKGKRVQLIKPKEESKLKPTEITSNDILSIPSKMPELKLNGFGQDVVEGMLKHIIMTPNTTISHQMEGKMLGLSRDEWTEFIIDFMSKSDNIAKYFGVPNKFQIVGRSRTLVYR